MARCTNEVLLNKIGLDPIKENAEIEFRLRTDLPDCRKISADAYIAASETPGYSKFRKPQNRFECMRTGCVNTGTINLATADATVTYRAMYDAVEFANGVVTYYVYVPQGTTFPVVATFKIGDDAALTNADVYTVNITQAMVTSDGFVPMFIDLSQTPASVEGNGWTPAPTGAYIQLSADKPVGYSSISIFDTIEDFETNDVVKVSCISTMGGTSDVELIQNRCQDAQYNDSINQLTFPLTGTRATPNYHKLNPLEGRGDAVTGFDTTTVKKTVEAYTYDTKNYGRVTLADAYQDVCGYFAIQIADSCDVTEASLTELSVPTITDIDAGHYQIIKNADGTTDIILNEEIVDMGIIVSYPKRVQIEEYVGNPDNLGSVHVSMLVPVQQSDGVKMVYIYENVFVTSFPTTITNETAEFAFTITIARDANGHFYKRQRIIG